VDGFIAKIERFQPSWVAFHGKEAAKVVSRGLGYGGAVSLGKQDWTVATRQAFVVPSASGSNRDRSRLEGKGSRRMVQGACRTPTVSSGLAHQLSGASSRSPFLPELKVDVAELRERAWLERPFRPTRRLSR
jgi:hypothetical protein